MLCLMGEYSVSFFSELVFYEMGTMISVFNSFALENTIKLLLERNRTQFARSLLPLPPVISDGGTSAT